MTCAVSTDDGLLANKVCEHRPLCVQSNASIVYTANGSLAVRSVVPLAIAFEVRGSRYGRGCATQEMLGYNATVRTVHIMSRGRGGYGTEETVRYNAKIRFALLKQQAAHHVDCCLMYRTLRVSCEPYFRTQRPGINHQQHVLAIHPFLACTETDEGLHPTPPKNGGTGSENGVCFLPFA